MLRNADLAPPVFVVQPELVTLKPKDAKEPSLSSLCLLHSVALTSEPCRDRKSVV